MRHLSFTLKRLFTTSQTISLGRSMCVYFEGSVIVMLISFDKGSDHRFSF